MHPEEDDDVYWYEDGYVDGFGEDDALAQEAIFGDAEIADEEPVLSEEFRFAPDMLVLEPSDKEYIQWLAVLCAAGCDYTLIDDVEAWLIVVPPHDAESARQQIDEYVAECQYWPPPKEDLTPWLGETGFVTRVMALGMLAFFILGLPKHDIWVDKGACDVDLFFAGEFWRAVTALTLHSDLPHVLGNVAGLWLVGGAVCRYLGEGFGWLLIMGSATLANFANAWYHRGDTFGYSFMGASTAVFAAFGALAALRFWRQIKLKDGRQPLYVPFFAALAIFALIGVGTDNVDITGHAFGMICGALATVFAPWLLRRKTRTGLQDAALVLVALAIALSWWRAY